MRAPRPHPGATPFEIEQFQAAARHAVWRALRSGQLVKEPCEVCGTSERVEAHHEDHAQQLDVNWLCRMHHRARHAYDKTVDELRTEFQLMKKQSPGLDLAVVTGPGSNHEGRYT